MALDEKTLTQLLKLKRFEQPPTGYYEQFLEEFQARQRRELVQLSQRSLAPSFRQLVSERLSELADSAWVQPLVAPVAAFRRFVEETLGEKTSAFSRLSYATACAAVLCVAGALTWNMLEHPGSGLGSSAAQLASQTPLLSSESFQLDTASPLLASNAIALTSLTPVALTPQVRIPGELLDSSRFSQPENFATPFLESHPAAFPAGSALPLTPASLKEGGEATIHFY